MSENNYSNNLSNQSIEPTVEVCSDIDTNESRSLDAISNYSQRTTAKYINRVERENLLQKLIPSQTRREIVQHELMLVKEEFDFRRKALAVSKEAQIQALKEKYNQYLIQGKSEIREKTTFFLMSKLHELEQKIDILDDEFNQMIEEKTSKVEAIKNPRLKQAREKDLNKTIDRFIDLKEQSLKSFEAIISEGIKQ